MIKLLRIDDRLIHGQVAVTWTSYLSANCIVVANDKAAKDPMSKMLLGLAKPPTASLEILTIEKAIEFCSDPANDDKKIFIVVESTTDALKVAREIKGIPQTVMGGIRSAEGKVRIERQVFLNELDIQNAEAISELGIETVVQVVPSEKKVTLSEAKLIYEKGK